MKFVNMTSNKRIDIICKKLNELFQSEVFREKMKALPVDSEGWTFKKAYTSSKEVNGAYVWLRLKNDPSIIEVFSYKNYFTKANGYTKNDGLTKVWLNTAKFGRSDASIAATLAHEGVHETDNNDQYYFYHHGDNKPKEGTGPEIVAAVVYEILAGVPSTQSSAI